MKPITIHPFSALAGVAVATCALLAISASQSTSPGSIQTLPGGPLLIKHVGPVQIVGIPAARDMIVIEEGIPFVVPAEKRFVLTAIGTISLVSPSVFTRFEVDGITELRTNSIIGMKTIPMGLSVNSGSTITLFGGGSNPVNDIRAWGYLEDE